MAPPLPMVPCKACAIGLGGATVGSPVWGVEMQHIEKQRERWGLGLRWPSFDYGKQQSTQSRWQWSVGCYRRAGGEGEHGGLHRPIIWGGEWNDKKINNIKYIMAFFDGLRSKINTQQPTQNRLSRWRGLLREGATSATRGGSTITSFLEGAKFKG
jgi:hypothetical protein